MHVTVHLGEPFWRTTGERRMIIRTDQPASISDLLNELGRLHPELGRLIRGEALENPKLLGPLWQKVHHPLPTYVLVNRRVVRQNTWDTTLLQDGDHLYIIVPTVGG